MFDKDFVFGVADSAYQVEGRDAADGMGDCIWDAFCAEGRTADGSDASVACDRIHRYREDIRLMHYLGIRHYRFSLNWCRILPEGTGRVNEKGIAFYRDMIQTMLDNGITPYLTLFHWEYPQALQNQGGWLNEHSGEWFAEYAKVVAENFSDLCEYFITFNEPQCFCGLGNLSGLQAPGYRLPYRETFRLVHNVLKAHGMAVKALRRYARRPIKIGYAPTCGVAIPESGAPEDIAAAKEVYFGFYNEMDNWTWNVSWFSDPVFLGHYPEEGLEKFAPYLPAFTEADMELIHQPLDFMGQNIYNGYPVHCGADGRPAFGSRKAGYAKTAANWPVTPECLYWGAKFLYERYGTPLYITENGMSCHDLTSADGRVHDPARIAFLDSYLGQAQRAVDEGADLRGYFLWTFLDNFEWEKGYRERFGLVYVDFQTQKRIVKDSAYWYQKVIESNGASLSCNRPKRPIIYLKPVLKEMIWGGSRLKSDFGYAIPGEDTGECWGISAHPNGDDTVEEDIFAGMTLSQLWKEQPYLFGNLDMDRFPLLIKIIDAKDNLSIQVHPDDAYAKAHENGSLGKTECWYIIDCPQGAELVIGHHARTREELEAMIREGRWDDFIRRIPIRKGDFIQIDPGTVHAITKGCLILETQQNSDITYRVYDYGRLTDGKPRELHIEKSIDVITVPAKSVEDSVKHLDGLVENVWHELISCDYYRVFKLNLNGTLSFVQTHPFLNMSVIEGSGIINGQAVKKGDHFILPAEYGEALLQGEMELIASSVNV